MPLIYFVAVLLTTLSFFKAVNLAPTDTETNIVDGDYATLGQFPYQVGLVHTFNGYETQFCGGTIINEDTIVTAAHCVDPRGYEYKYGKDYMKKFIIRAGVANIFQDFDTRQDRKIISMKIHPIWENEVEYDSDHNPEPNSPADIAILKVEPFVLNNYVQKKEFDDRTTPIDICVISGWGSHSFENLNLSNDFATLKWAQIKITNRKDPSLIIGQKDTGLTAKGDSGGPLVCNGKLSGVVSYGNIDHTGTRISAFTDVSYYSNWISKNN